MIFSVAVYRTNSKAFNKQVKKMAQEFDLERILQTSRALLSLVLTLHLQRFEEQGHVGQLLDDKCMISNCWYRALKSIT